MTTIEQIESTHGKECARFYAMGFQEAKHSFPATLTYDAAMPVIQDKCAKAGVPVESFFTNSRGERYTSDLRTIICYEFAIQGYTYSSIGRVVGRTHATVIFHIKKYRQLTEIGDKEFLKFIEKVK